MVPDDMCSFSCRKCYRPETEIKKPRLIIVIKIGLPLSIAELTKERLRRAAKKIKDETPMFAGDIGFRVFKLDTSNIRVWEPDRDNLKETLLDSIDHIKPDRSEDDILYELLLKLGLTFACPSKPRPS